VTGGSATELSGTDSAEEEPEPEDFRLHPTTLA